MTYQRLLGQRLPHNRIAHEKGPGSLPGLRSCRSDRGDQSFWLSTPEPIASAGDDIVVSSVMSMPLASFECQKP